MRLIIKIIAGAVCLVCAGLFVFGVLEETQNERYIKLHGKHQAD